MPVSDTANVSSDVSSEIVSNICDVINTSFPHKASGEALVVSVYGEWGIGKTWHLRQIEKHYSKSENLIWQDSNTEDNSIKHINIPVFFSPWKYEQEDFLIIPLLKTIENQLEKYQSKIESHALTLTRAVTDQLKSLLIKTGETIADLTRSVATGLSFDFGVIKFSGKDSLESAAASDAKKNEATKKMESMYYGTFESLEQLTQSPDDDKLKIRIIVLVDDLDRCLPDNAVQMLESIKLFLNINNFAFVLAVDDEVVERGINHRYKDYFLEKDRDSNISPPITGAEYLEKIVHIPIHLPRWSQNQTQAYLIEHYPSLFVVEEKAEDAQKASQIDDRQDEQPEDKHAETKLNLPLLNLFNQAIPPVPRKLIRAAEAIQLKRDTIQNLEGGKEFINQHDQHLEHLARITILEQQFSSLYRLLRSNEVVYNWLFECKMSYRFEAQTIVEEVDKSNKEALEGTQNPTSPITVSEYQLAWHQFKNLLRESKRNRYSIDPLAAFHGNEIKSNPITDDEALNQFEALYLKNQAIETQKHKAPVQIINEDHLETISNVDLGELQSGFMLPDISSRRDFIRRQEWRHKKLPDPVFHEWLELFRSEEYMTSNETLVTDIEWLEDLADITSAIQLTEFYKTTRVLERIQNLGEQLVDSNHG